MVAHPGIDKIHFTGSGATAKRILDTAKDVLKPVGLELGGKSANIIFADADLGNAAMQAILGMQGSGQGCINGTRVLIERPVYEEVLTLIQGILGTLEVGDPLVASTFFGPVINETAADRIMGVIEKAKTEARLIAGGERLGGELADGFFISPTVFADVDNSDAAGPRRDLRTGSGGHAVRHRGGGRPDRQRLPLRPRRLHPDLQPQARTHRRPAARGRQHLDQRLPRDPACQPRSAAANRAAGAASAASTASANSANPRTYM